MQARITGHTAICMIVGNPIKFTLSPVMHNTAYQAAGIDDKFVFVCCEVGQEHTSEIANLVRVMGIRGLTCTNPHNTRILEYLDEVDPVAQAIGSVNTVVNQQRRLIGYNTDWIGAIAALERATVLGDQRVALLGTGGAARAIALGLRERGADMVIFGRVMERAAALATTIDGTALTFDNISEVADCSLVINATPVGKSPFGETLVPASCLRPGQIVMDAVYTPFKTRLLVEAEEIGARIIPGMEMLLHQGAAQFELYTGCPAPIATMRQSLVDSLKGTVNLFGPTSGGDHSVRG